ncbi:MAG: TolC family protein [Bryobacteraceae bacterium]|nr:TolC family protein [Bryobacteraceae bacterium]MCX7602686.1 TolC family protein [Bryobacteraceae bacterium]
MFETFLLCFLASGQAGGELARLVEEALERNPEIQAARRKLEAARQRPAAAASLPEPMVSIGYASIGGPLPGQGLGREPMARAGFMASQTLPAPGKRSLRRRIALEEAGAAGQEYAMVERRVVARLKAAWYELHHAWEMLDVAARNRALLERLFRLASARYQAGQGSQKELLDAQMRLTLLEAKAEGLEQMRRRSEAEINALRARPLEEPVARPSVGEPREALVRLEELYERARLESPALAALRHQVRRAELGLELARRESLPDVTFAAGYYNMGGMPPMFEAKVDIPLPLLRRTKLRAEAAGQAHEAEAARRSYQATGNELLFRIKDEWLAGSAAWRLLRIYSTTLVPQTALALEAAMAAYEAGRGTFADVLAQAAAMLDAEENYHAALRDYHLTLVRLEEMTGADLSGED